MMGVEIIPRLKPGGLPNPPHRQVFLISLFVHTKAIIGVDEHPSPGLRLLHSRHIAIITKQHRRYRMGMTGCDGIFWGLFLQAHNGRFLTVSFEEKCFRLLKRLDDCEGARRRTVLMD